MELSEKAKQKRNEYQRKWKARNRDKINEYHSNWRKRNRDKVREYQRIYWERKALKDSVTDVSVTSVTCLECCKEFIPKRKTAKFCSPACRVKYNRKH